jgi:hypothetical protein
MKLFQYQIWHLLSLLLLLWGLYYFVGLDSNFLDGELWGLRTGTWFGLALLSPILHQLYVWLCWRLELYYQLMTRVFGKEAFKLFKIGFAVLIISRPVTLILLAISNAFTLKINAALSYGISVLLLIPGIYLMYSVKTYFGFDRAFGIDHFDPERYRNASMVKQGIFKYSSNAMYVYGFFLLWVPGILAQSKAALLIAAFNHVYIWVHYYFTEKPDMKAIYG